MLKNQRNYQFFLLILSSGSLIAVAQNWTDKVVGTTDEDTLRIMKEGKEIKVRLHGVDAPEDGQP